MDALKLDFGGDILSDATFSGKTFHNFEVNPPHHRAFVIRDVVFEDCKVSPGTCFITRGVTLENVVFKNFQCGDAMHIASEVVMRNVTIEGRYRPKMLWIRPSIGAEAGMAGRNEECALDITGYTGEVSITGVDVNGVKTNPDQQVKMRLEAIRSVDWKSLQGGMLGYWRIMAKKIEADGAREGIFSVPAKESRNYDKAMADLEFLRKSGFVE
jgi:hypothetical protein